MKTTNVRNLVFGVMMTLMGILFIVVCTSMSTANAVAETEVEERPSVIKEFMLTHYNNDIWERIETVAAEKGIEANSIDVDFYYENSVANPIGWWVFECTDESGDWFLTTCVPIDRAFK